MPDLVGLTDAGDWLAGLNLMAAVFVLPEILAEVGLNQPRRDGVDANAVRRLLDG